MGEDKACCSEEKHQCHICMLKGKGKTHQIRDLTSSPNVACSNCGEEANTEDNVCMPVPLFI
jgi:hypothetical protein